MAPHGQDDSGTEIESLLRKCMNDGIDADMRTEFRSGLLVFEITDLVRGLQTYLLSENSGTRREAVSTLSWLAGCHPRITPGSIPHLVAFFCSRLSDWASVEPSVQGIRTLYAHHIKPEWRLQYVEESEAVRSRDRSDLSLLLGLPGVSSLPAESDSMTERVIAKLLINVHAPSFGQQVRFEVLELFKLWIKDFGEELVSFSDIVVRGLGIEGEDERDVACLTSFFEAINLLFLSPLYYRGNPKALEDLFEILKSYFPVQFVAREKDSEHLGRLRILLSDCMVHFRLQSIEFLTPHLNDPSMAEDAYLTLIEIGKKCPNELIPFLLGEWNTNPSLLLRNLWQATISVADSEIVEGLVSRLVSQGDEDELLVICAETNVDILVVVLKKVLNQGKLLSPSFVSKVRLDNVDISEGSMMSETVANGIVEKLNLSEPSGMRLVCKLMKYVSDAKILENMVEMVKIALKSDFLLTNEITECISNLSKFHPSILLTNINSVHLLARLVTENSETAGILALSLFNAGIWSQDHLAAIAGKFFLLSSAWKSPHFCDMFFTQYLETSLVACSSLDAESLATILLNCSSSTSSTLLLRDLILGETSRLDLIPYLGAEKLKQALLCADVWEDLLSVCLTRLSEELAMRTVPVIAEAGEEEQVLRIMRHCENPKIWAKTMHAMSKKPGKNFACNIFDQISVDRIEYFLAEGDNVDSDLVDLLRLIKTGECEGRITVGILNSLSSPELLISESKMVESCLGGSFDHVGIYKLLIKYLLVLASQQNEGVRESVVVEWVKKICGELNEYPADLRFAAVQALAIIPETVASGKLESVVPLVSQTLRNSLDKEPKQVIRKQIAIGITGWFNILVS